MLFPWRPGFWTNSVKLTYIDPNAGVQWWGDVFGARRPNLFAPRDHPPEEVRLRLGFEQPTIYICAPDARRGWEVTTHPIVKCRNLERARNYCERLGLDPGPIEGKEGPPHFEIQDPEGYVIEVCAEVAPESAMDWVLQSLARIRTNPFHFVL